MKPKASIARSPVAPLTAWLLLAAPLLALVVAMPPSAALVPTDDAEATDWVIIINDTPTAADPSLPSTPVPDSPTADLRDVSLREEGVYLDLRVRSDLPTETGQTDAPSTTFTLTFTLSHQPPTTSGQGQAPNPVEGHYTLTVDPDGLVTIDATGIGTADAEYGLPAGMHAASFTVRIPKADLLAEGILQTGDTVTDPVATLDSGSGMSDRAPNQGTGDGYTIMWAPGALVPNPIWETTAGSDFAAGPDALHTPDGRILISYLVYGDPPSTGQPATSMSPGAYLAELVGGAIAGVRIGDVRFPDNLHEDERTRVAMTQDDDGTIHVVYAANPGSTGQQVFHHAMATINASDITVTQAGSPFDEAVVGTELNNSYGGVPDVTAAAGRVVACLPAVHNTMFHVVEFDGDKWTRLETIKGADGHGVRFCKLAIDAAGDLHVAFFRETQADEGRGVDEGDLVYRTEDGAETTIATGLEDISDFWASATTDGGFDFALDPAGMPTFAFEADSNRDLDGPRFAMMRDGTVEIERAPGLVPTHGNPLLAVRLRYDGDGYAHVVAGYGSTDTYGVRGPDGFWAYQDLDRTDAFTATVSKDGRAVIVGTQPHGGTTLEALRASHRPGTVDPLRSTEAYLDPGNDDGAENPLPGPMPALVVGSLVALVGLGTSGARVAADRAPRTVAPAFALIGGFSRLSKDKMQEHETRDRMIRVLQAEPGIGTATLRERLDLPRSTFFYHLRRLESESLVRLEKEGVHIFCRVTTAPTLPRPPSTPRNLLEREQRLLEMTRVRPGMRSADYAEALGWNPRTVHERLRQLERRELVHRDRLGTREVRWNYTGPEPEDDGDPASQDIGRAS